jgi:hypothetical protein
MGNRRKSIGYRWERDHLKDQDVGDWIILRWIGQIGWGGVGCVGLDQDKDRWRALVNAVMSLRVP